MAAFECKCGLAEENHIWDGGKHMMPGYGPDFPNEDCHWTFCSTRWTTQPLYPWGSHPHGLSSWARCFLADPQAPKLSLEAAHLLCNKSCALFTATGTAGYALEFFYRAYAAWFHHARIDTTRCRFLMERLECSGMNELQGLTCPDDLNRQTVQFIRALKPIHQTLCDAVEAKLNNITEKDSRYGPNSEPEEGVDEFQYGVVYTPRTRTIDDPRPTDSIMTHDHYRLRSEFTFAGSFKQFFVFIDEEDMESKGVTLVELGRTSPRGEGWHFDIVSETSWYRNKPGKVLELFLELVGLPPSEHPGIMHGTQRPI